MAIIFICLFALLLVGFVAWIYRQKQGKMLAGGEEMVESSVVVTNKAAHV